MTLAPLVAESATNKSGGADVPRGTGSPLCEEVGGGNCSTGFSLHRRQDFAIGQGLA